MTTSHGIDSLNCTLGSLLEAAAMGLGATRTGAFAALVPTLPMYFSTWETYHTHTLFLGAFNGPTEGLIIACSLMVLSGIFGPGIYHTPLSAFITVDHPLASFTGADLLPAILLITFFNTHVPGCVDNVIKARRAANLPLKPVFLQLTPMVIYTVATCLWLVSPHSIVLPENYLVLWCLTHSFVFGRLTTKIILAHLTRQPFPYWTVLLTPLVGGSVLFGLVPMLMGGPVVDAQWERVYLWAYFVFAIVVYARWAVLVIDAITNYLGINCLTIPAEKQRKNEEARRKAKSG